MSVAIHVDCAPGEARIAVWARDGLRDYAIWRPGAPDGVGDVLRGRVIARVPAMAGSFVALPNTEGFLPDSAGGDALRVGAAVGVRIVRAAQGGKGPRLSAMLDSDSAERVGVGPPALLRSGPTPVERMAALWPDAPVLVSDPAVQARVRATLGARCQPGSGFDDALAAAADGLAQPEMELPGGARAYFEPTKALVAIDIDLGAATADQRGKRDAQRAANMMVLPALARALRLRNLGGAILVDFGGLGIRQRAALGPPLAAALATDPLAPRLLGFTELGLAEILRPRVHPPLHELLIGPHAAALAALRAAEARVRGRLGHPARLVCTPALHAAITADADARADFARRTGHVIELTSDPAHGPPGWHLA